MKKIICLTLVLISLTFSVFSQEKTKVNSPYAERLLIGKHMLSLQWISWDYFGTANVTKKEGVYYLKGSQKSRENDDIVTVDGVITEINRYNFKFDGQISTKVSHINNGEECLREGVMTFSITGKRKYWRLQDIDNPCDEAADYVDVFFRR